MITSRSPSLVQLGREVCALGLGVGKVSCAGRAVELTLPWEVVVYVEHRLLSLLLLDSQLVLDLVHVFSPKVGRRRVENWVGLVGFRFRSVLSSVQFISVRFGFSFRFDFFRSFSVQFVPVRCSSFRFVSARFSSV